MRRSKENNPGLIAPPNGRVEYVDDIYAYSYYRETEVSSYVSQNYMYRQFDINEKMKAILIDWLTEEKLMVNTCFHEDVSQGSTVRERVLMKDILCANSKCFKLMVAYHQKAGTGKLTGVHRNYSTSKFGYAAKTEPAQFLLDL
ncbi:hypothetical protein PTKIN_Ptkin10aG0172900 [Pterospermum kingtungense]